MQKREQWILVYYNEYGNANTLKFPCGIIILLPSSNIAPEYLYGILVATAKESTL